MSLLSRPRALAAPLAVALLLIGAASAEAAPAPGVVRGADSPSAIPGSYLVKLRKSQADAVPARARDLSGRHGGRLGHVWQTLHEFSVSLSQKDARTLATEPDVEYVEQDQRRSAPHVRVAAAPAVRPAGAQEQASWGLDRIDQHALPLDGHYSYDDSAGQGVHAYVLSTGIDIAHPDFQGRAAYGPNFIPDGQPNSDDCVGSGTEVAGVIGGAQFGVAKKASLVAVRIFGCDSIASSTSIMDGFDWVIGHAIRPAVILFDLNDLCVFSDGSTGPCSEEVAQSFIAAQEAAFAAGISVVDGAGDHDIDTCGKSSGAAPHAFYVGATTSGDAKAGFSNWGPCLTMWAPGDSVVTDTPTGATTDSASVLAAGYVAGTVALFLGKPEFAGASPAQIRTELITNRATAGVVAGLDPGSPNLLLFTGPPGLISVGSPLAMAPSADGRLGMFGTNRAGYLFQRLQTAPGSPSWTPWVQSTTAGWLSVGAGSNADGRMQLAGLTPAGDLWTRAQMTPGSATWSIWTKLDRPSGSAPVGRTVLAHNHSNRLEVFAGNQQGQVFYRSQTSPGAKTWTAWTYFSVAAKLRSLAAAVDTDGRIEIFGVDDAGRVWHAAQTSATDNNWTSFATLGGFGMTAIAAAHSGDGTLELVGVDAGGNAFHRRQTAPGAGTWSAWSALPSRTLADVAVAADPDGRVEVIAVDNLGRIWRSLQTGPGSASYAAWSQLDGQLRP